MYSAVSDSLQCYGLQAPLSIGFPRQEYWSGLPFPSPGDLLNSGIKSMSPALAGGLFTTEPPTVTISYIRSSDFIQLITNILYPFTNLSLFWFDSWVGKICRSRESLHTPVFLGFPCGSACKESACNAEELDSISGLGRSSGEGKGYPLWPGEFHGLSRENCP